MIEVTTTVVLAGPLERVLERPAKERILEQCLVKELRGGLKHHGGAK